MYICIVTYTHACTLPHTHTHLETACLPIYPPNQGTLTLGWVTCLQTLNLVRQENPQKGGWVTDNSRDLGQKTWLRCKHHLVHCMMKSHCWLARPTQRTPDPNWSPPHGQGQGATISYIKRQDDVTMSAMRGLKAWTHILQLFSLVKVAQNIYSIP